MNDIITLVAKDLSISLTSVENTMKLLLEDNTVPFIARYRKEFTGNLDEVQIRDIERKNKYYSTLKDRKAFILESIKSQEKLTNELQEQIQECFSLSTLEDIYLPYKPKKKTRASVAKEKGLEGLANLILDSKNPQNFASDYINKEKGVETEKEALKGAMDIVAETVSEDFEIRKFMKEYIYKEGVVVAAAKEMKENSSFDMYKDYKEPIRSIKPHRVLAVRRGEDLKELSIKLVYTDDDILENIYNYFIIEENPYIKESIHDGYKRLLKPSIEREVFQILYDKAEEQAIHIFSENLKQLLMQRPLKGQVILGIDPGIRTGSKFSVISHIGELLHYGVFDQKNVAASSVTLTKVCKDHNVQLVAIGNGTGGRQVEQIIEAMINSILPEVKYAMVPETGASVYSASDAAREEFPDLDLTIRGAISIARRLQDPISELVKIDPKSLGVGQYQHDVNQSYLSQELSNTVEDCVNKVGVNLNTASFELLKHVSGLTPSLARKIALHRKLNGQFHSRFELQDIKGLGTKVFEQAAGFLKIPISKNILDNTWVHPENYDLAHAILQHKDTHSQNIKLSREVIAQLENQFNIKETLIKSIIKDLEKQNLDPRDELDAPILKDKSISLETLSVGTKLKGTVRNIVDFGAFIDIGLKNDGLVHISEMSNRFIKHPLEVLEIGNVVDVMIIEIDKIKGKVKLSIKKSLES